MKTVYHLAIAIVLLLIGYVVYQAHDEYHYNYCSLSTPSASFQLLSKQSWQDGLKVEPTRKPRKR